MSKSKLINIYLGHPAHYHLFKNVIKNLKADGYEVDVLIKKKENLEQLLQNDGVPYYNILREGRKDSKFGIALGVFKRIWRLFWFVVKRRPLLLIGTSVENSYVGPLLRIPAIYVGEDDAPATPTETNVCYPGAKDVVTPSCCDDGKWAYKTTKYPSYHELAYLHPNHFTPSADIVRQQGINPDKPYAIMRFVKLKANHDDNIKGINLSVAMRLVEIMKPHMDIYITSERELEPELEPYRIKINPIYMHDVMAFASLYIGDSQTMAAEAGVLGVPFVRFNDFVGRIGYLRELEDKYELGYGIHASVLPADSPIRRNDGSVQPSGVEELYKRVEELVAMPSDQRRKLWSERRTQMLSDKIDCAKFLTYFIENYPNSATEVKNATPDFWDRFK